MKPFLYSDFRERKILSQDKGKSMEKIKITVQIIFNLVL